MVLLNCFCIEGSLARVSFKFSFFFFVSKVFDRIKITLNFIMALLTRKISFCCELNYLSEALEPPKSILHRLLITIFICNIIQYDKFVCFYCSVKTQAYCYFVFLLLNAKQKIYIFSQHSLFSSKIEHFTG